MKSMPANISRNYGITSTNTSEVDPEKARQVIAGTPLTLAGHPSLERCIGIGKNDMKSKGILGTSVRSTCTIDDERWLIQ
jgi:hypothetical protein